MKFILLTLQFGVVIQDGIPHLFLYCINTIILSFFAIFNSLKPKYFP